MQSKYQSRKDRSAHSRFPLHQFQMDIGDNAINFNAYRLVVEDLLALFQAVNEAVVNILEHYFTMSQLDAKLALEIYKRFAQQTQETMEYLDNARKIQHELCISIPVVNHVSEKGCKRVALAHTSFTFVGSIITGVCVGRVLE